MWDYRNVKLNKPTNMGPFTWCSLQLLKKSNKSLTPSHQRWWHSTHGWCRRTSMYTFHMPTPLHFVFGAWCRPIHQGELCRSLQDMTMDLTLHNLLTSLYHATQKR